jgi:hypothetical protein
MNKQSQEDRETELKDVMVEEGSRGRPQPVYAVSLDFRRRMNFAAKLLADDNCDREYYLEAIRDRFGLQDESPELLLFLKAWDECR